MGFFERPDSDKIHISLQGQQDTEKSLMGKKKSAGAQTPEIARPAIRFWLFSLAGLIFLMVLVGGATRLTDSGLSITEWQPIVGAIPPLSAEDWNLVFKKYQQIPEYRLVNKGMSLDDFKTIFWWEWGHRFLGRLIGFAFLLPFLFFWLSRRISGLLMPKLLFLFGLGGLQGGLGWYMVKSGLTERVDVSQYRLAAHLGLAVLIFAAILWVAFELKESSQNERPSPLPRRLKYSAASLTALIYLQIIAGAFVAGLDAGLVYNNWPLMEGRWIPPGLFKLSPLALNFFENHLTVQFTHRLLAYGIVALTFAHSFMVIRIKTDLPQMSRIKRSAGLLTAAILMQLSLGIWTLLARVPIELGLSHQAGGMVVLTLALYHLHLFAALKGLGDDRQRKFQNHQSSHSLPKRPENADRP